MNTQPVKIGMASDALTRAIDAAGRQIPPLWPLASQVAVNPYLGQADLRLAEAAAQLQRIGAGPLTMGRDWYRERLADGRLTDRDLADALAASPYRDKPESLAALKAALYQPQPESRALPTLADLAAEASGMDWSAILAERIGMWAGSRFDAGQALWGAATARTAFADYRAFAMHDITPEIVGLRGFAAFVADAPETAEAAITRAVQRLGLSEQAVQSYAHQLLMTLGGWSQYARHLLWRAELVGQTDDTLTGMLAIRLLWEEALFQQYEAQIVDAWVGVRAVHATPAVPGQAEILAEILQEATERVAQRKLAGTLGGTALQEEDARPALQAAFCIDVRSEIFRRALEAIDPSIRTLGFAGFFGMAIGHRGFASDVEEMRLPVLLNPSVHSCATASGQEEADTDTRLKARAHRAWGRFKLAAVSSFAFVEAAGPVYGAKLIRDALGWRAATGKVQPRPHFQPGLALPDRIAAAETILRAVSLTKGFARIVLLAGHGADVANNPHASALQCGACGGYSGEVNARLLAGLLNDPAVRQGLAGQGIDIPTDTLFLAGLHDTTTDKVTLFDGDCDTSAHRADLARVQGWLVTAGKIARTERAIHLPHADAGKGIERRAGDWAEIRPEWGLAGCSAFIAAPRGRTAGANLEGRAFLHDYRWRQDCARGFPVLELILTAPVVVASWISLQYYGSTVAPDVFGAGNKLLHNVVGGIGVVEGNGGILRSGLAWQSIHDGQTYRHEPLRLSVCIEAPREAMTDILSRHPGVKALFDNGWLHLFALDDAGRMAWRYAGDLSWIPVERAGGASSAPWTPITLAASLPEK